MNKFLSTLQKAGFLTDEVIGDGKIHRVATKDKPHKENGWYIYYADEHPIGVFGDWSTGEKYTWRTDKTSSLSPDERKTRRDKWRKIAKERAQEQERVYAEAAQTAQKIWQNAGAAPDDFPYLQTKQVKDFGLRFSGDRIVIPVYECTTGKLISVQCIDKEGDKKFLSGGKIKAGYFPMGRPKDGKLYLCEGYATGATIHQLTGCGVAIAFNAGNLKPVAQALRAKYPDLQLIVAGDNDRFKETNTGRDKAVSAAKAVGCSYVIPEFPAGTNGTDFNDLFTSSSKDEVLKQLSKPVTPEPEQPDINVWLSGDIALDTETVLNTLAATSPLQSDTFRKPVSDKLGIRVSTLDSELAKRRKTEKKETYGLGFEEIEPHADPVSGDELLLELTKTIEDIVILEDGYSLAVALWVIFCYTYDSFDVCAPLFITSPTKRCGKTKLLSLLLALTPRALVTSNISPAAVFRTIEEFKPTLFVDEADRFLKFNDELIGILNSGHTRTTAFAVRTVGDDYQPKRFSTWCPKAIASIGSLAGTLTDRSIEIAMRRKTTDEKVQNIRPSKLPELMKPLRGKIARWVMDNQNAIEEAVPDMPACSNERATDNWTPFFQIAEIAGTNWLTQTRDLFIKATGAERPDDNIKIELLNDIQAIFIEQKTDKIFTTDLIKELCKLEERPWSTYNKGKEISARQVAKHLASFGISSKTIRIGLDDRKGYLKEAFTDTFTRFIPEKDTSPVSGGILSVEPSTRNNNNGISTNSIRNKNEISTDKNCDKSCNNNEIDGLTDRKGVSEEERIKDGKNDLFDPEFAQLFEDEINAIDEQNNQADFDDDLPF